MKYGIRCNIYNQTLAISSRYDKLFKIYRLITTVETSKVLFEVRDCNQIPAIDSRDTSINYDYENFESFNRANDQSVSTKWLKLRELKIPARDEREKIDHRGSRGTRRSFPDLSQTAIIQLNADLSQR